MLENRLLLSRWHHYRRRSVLRQREPLQRLVVLRVARLGAPPCVLRKHDGIQQLHRGIVGLLRGAPNHPRVVHVAVGIAARRGRTGARGTGTRAGARVALLVIAIELLHRHLHTNQVQCPLRFVRIVAMAGLSFAYVRPFLYTEDTHGVVVEVLWVIVAAEGSRLRRHVDGEGAVRPVLRVIAALLQHRNLDVAAHVTFNENS